MDTFLDTSFVVAIIIKTDKTEDARKFFEEADGLTSSMAVYEESFYVGLRLTAEKIGN